MKSQRYSPKENEDILAAKEYGDLAKVAQKYGRSVKALSSRRKNLKRQQKAKIQPPKRIQTPLTSPPFARPAWFDEDLETMSRGPKPFISRFL